MIEGISHITFIVSDLERMSTFLTKLFDAEEIYSSDGKNFSISSEKFFRIGGLWIAIMEGNPLTEKSYNHIAFKITDSEFDKYLSRLSSLNIEVLSDRDRIGGEGRSVYFYDYDNHLFELHAGNLEARLKVYQQEI